MSKWDSIRDRILSGRPDTNIRFEDLCRFLLRIGFSERVRGSHHIFVKSGIRAALNLQPKGSMAKPYQIKQVRAMLLEYGGGGASDSEV